MVQSPIPTEFQGMVAVKLMKLVVSRLQRIVELWHAALAPLEFRV